MNNLNYIAAFAFAEGGSGEGYTPTRYIEMARTVLGSIDLDPASCRLANQTVRAIKYYDKQVDALKQPWHGNIWLNPPYTRGVVSKFVTKFTIEAEAGRVKSGIILANVQTNARWWHQLLTFCDCACISYRPLKFLSGENGAKFSLVQTQTFFYYGLNVDLFKETFSTVGTIIRAEVI